MRRGYVSWKEISLTRRTTGKTVVKRCVEFKESEEDYILVKGGSSMRLEAELFPKRLWRVANRPAVAIPEPRTKSFEEELDEVEETDHTSDEVPAEVIDQIEGRKSGPGAPPKEQSPGDLKVQLPGEYNTNAPHDEGITKEEMEDRMVTLQAHVDTNFAIQDGQRKIALARHRRMMRETVERRGVGYE